MIFNSNAIVNPCTMMIEPIYTLSTNVAMSGLLVDNLACSTNPFLFKILIKFQEGNMLRLLDISWVRKNKVSKQTFGQNE